MRSVITTHDIEIFKIFINHKLNSYLTNDMILYIDKEDISEYEPYLQKNWTVFSRKDILKFYKRIPAGIPYYIKIMVWNMIFHKLNLKDSLYFSDDDVLIYDKSFEDIKNSSKIIYDIDFTLMFHSNKLQYLLNEYEGYDGINNFILKNKGDNIYGLATTNFFIPVNLINEYISIYKTLFDEFNPIMINNETYINKLNIKTRASRKVAFSNFMMEHPFLDTVLSKFLPSQVSKIKFYILTLSPIHSIKLKNPSYNSYELFDNYFKTRDIYPKVQPIVHVCINKKHKYFKNTFNYLNNIAIDDIDNIMKGYKINKKYKHLYKIKGLI